MRASAIRLAERWLAEPNHAIQAEVLKQREHLEKMATVVFKGGGDALTAWRGRWDR